MSERRFTEGDELKLIQCQETHPLLNQAVRAAPLDCEKVRAFEVLCVRAKFDLKLGKLQIKSEFQV